MKKVDEVNLADIRVALQNRGLESGNGKKEELLERLKKEGAVELPYKELEEYSVKQIQCELRIKGMDDTPAKKDDLIERYKGDISEVICLFYFPFLLCFFFV